MATVLPVTDKWIGKMNFGICSSQTLSEMCITVTVKTADGKDKEITVMGHEIVYEAISTHFHIAKSGIEKVVSGDNVIKPRYSFADACLEVFLSTLHPPPPPWDGVSSAQA